MEIKEQIFTRYIHLIDFCRLNWDEASLEKIENAFRFAQSIIGERTFKTGEVILSHSLEVANVIATEIGMGVDSVVAGILHNIMYSGFEVKDARGEIEKKIW